MESETGFGGFHGLTKMTIHLKENTIGAPNGASFFMKWTGIYMGLLEDAANAWNTMQNRKYYLLLGRAGKSEEFTLSFHPRMFPHLAGFQYLNDIDLGIHRSEIFNGKLISKILSGKIKTEDILKSEKWENIKGRLLGIVELENTLDSQFLIHRFDPSRVPHGSLIEANYVIKNLKSGVTFFVFIDEKNNEWFCRSIFRMEQTDYTINQARLTVLKKEKYIDEKLIFSYTHPNYKKS